MKWFGMVLLAVAAIAMVHLAVRDSALGGAKLAAPMPTPTPTGAIIPPVPKTHFEPQSNQYVVIGWNNLGMHCQNPSFAKLAVLPPGNTLMVQVIQRGNPPKLVTSGVTVTYSVLDNTTCKNKTDFWTYVKPLFGVNLPLGVGLTGNKLTGTMVANGDHFEATFIPVLPFNDKMVWNPYQVAYVTVKPRSGPAVTSEVVLPVSDEIRCDQCHAQNGDGTVNLAGGGVASIEQNILLVHDFYHPECDLAHSEPVLCADCHKENAMGKPGDGTSKSLSLAMHGWHQQSPDAACYSCHPGPRTFCQRTAIGQMGPSGTDPNCQRCHGTLAQVATDLQAGREPWLQEPTCEQCHGSIYSTGTTLYRESAGHGGLRCAACHNSPHAWYPSTLAVDNLQPNALQHSPTPLGNCSVCHTKKKVGNNPHVTYNWNR
jgi:hypothetical protein